jgi:hypothetical protein
MDDAQLIPYAEAIKRSGLSRRTWYDRLRQTSGIRVFVDGRDRRLRMIDARDLPRLTQIEPVKRRTTSAA